MVYLPILGAFFLAVGTVLERFVLKVKNIEVNAYQTASFLAIMVALSPLLYFFWRVDPGALDARNIFIFCLVVLFSIVANLFVFYSLKGEKIVNLVPAKEMESVFVILLAIVFSFIFGGLYERNFHIIIPALISGAALLFSHIKRHHLQFNKYFVSAIFGSLFFAIELILSRLILDLYSPITFYFLRCSAIFLISLIVLKPNFQGFTGKIGWQILLTGVAWAGYRVVLYYGYLSVGIVFTTLILMLGPVFIYIFAHFFLKEKMSWKNFITAIIIVASVVYVLLT